MGRDRRQADRRREQKRASRTRAARRDRGRQRHEEQLQSGRTKRWWKEAEKRKALAAAARDTLLRTADVSAPGPRPAPRIPPGVRLAAISGMMSAVADETAKPAGEGVAPSHR